MLRVGLTGGIGAGKSAVSARLAAAGARVLDADRIARDVVEPGTPGLDAVVAAFGRDVLGADGALDRRRLGGIVFADPDARARLNALVHPRVAARTGELLAAVPAGGVVVHDIPLLVENGLAPEFHLVVVVWAPAEVRVARLVDRRGMTPVAARERLDAQASDAERAAVADVLLANDGTLADLHARVDALWTDRLVPYARNLTARVAPASRPHVVAPDPHWPAQAARAAARLRRVLGDRAAAVEHIGSTAVPGLAAKDVLDLQATVRGRDDLDTAAAALAGSGWVPRPDLTSDLPDPAEPDPAGWEKRFARSADPGRLAHLHLRVDGAPNARFAVLFRDYLRAHPDEVARYGEAKRRVAAVYAGDPDAVRYTEAKQPVVDAIGARARRWAAERSDPRRD